MKVLMISKACVVGAYQQKLELIGTHPDIDLTVAVPPSWRDERGILPLDRRHVDGYTLSVEPILFNGSFHLHFYPRIGHIISKIKPDIVHIDEEPYNLATWHATLLARRHNARTLFFSWQNIARRYPWPFNILEAYVLRCTDFAICGSQVSSMMWRKKGYLGPTAIIPQFGVDPDLFQWRKHMPTEERSFTIGYIGRLVPEKGVDLLLRAMADLDGNVRVRLIGAGPFQENLRRLAEESGLLDRVEFLPWIESHEIPGQLRRMDTLVLPSRTQSNWKEQFGRVLVEAMATGVPVVGSDCGEIPNVIDDAGIVFPEGNLDALTHVLQKLKANPQLRQDLAERGRARIMANYTHEIVAGETVRVYQRLVNEKQTHLDDTV